MAALAMNTTMRVAEGLAEVVLVERLPLARGTVGGSVFGQAAAAEAAEMTMMIRVAVAVHEEAVSVLDQRRGCGNLLTVVLPGKMAK